MPVHTGPNPGAKTRNDTGNNKMRMDSTDRETGGLETGAKKAEHGNAAGVHASPKKRRKVNHACVYCRRSHMTCDSERPCTRCIKRNIGHLCHDEPREPSKRSRNGEYDQSFMDDEGSSNEFPGVQGMPRNVDVQDAAGQQLLADGGGIGLAPSTVNPAASAPSQGLGSNPQQVLQYNDWIGGQSQFQDMHNFHPSYMFNAPEVTNEYNLLGDFLSSSLLDDGSIFQNDDMHPLYSDPTLINSMATLGGPNAGLVQQPQMTTPAQNQTTQSESIQNDKARETYYMTAADPSGSDPPEERMNKLLKAKYDAGLLKPFNYVKGYARLNQYMEKNMQQVSRQKILRQLDKFRPKFRERMQSLTDIELILVEMWFERSLMEYDRVFASMAIPACCWRRTGEIFRGNKEMAQLIGVPIGSLRDGKLAIHEIIVEDQLVSYWEKFGAIAFDNTQKAMLTSCTLKNPDSTSPGDGIRCCFSFTIRRDTHNILVTGNTIRIGVSTDEVDTLAEEAFQNKIDYDSSSQQASNKTCSVENAAVRREWGSLKPSERKKFTDAVLCLMEKSPNLSAPDALGIRSRYDDFVSVHIRKTENIHFTGSFLTWHRYYIWLYEKALREECGYDGYLPYWAWEKYSEDPLNSPLFDGSEYSMSGNGAPAPNNGSTPRFHPIVHIPAGEGGGCVTSGPFKNMTVNLGPVTPNYQSPGIKPQPGNGLGHNPRCLRRDITSFTTKKWTRVEDVVGLLKNYTDVGHFQLALQGIPLTDYLGVHGGGHAVLGGDPGSDLHTSPGDPMFFLHHSMIDRVFWTWQNLDPENRRHVASGSMTMHNMPPSRDVRLNDMIDMGGLGESYRLDDLLDSTGGPFCYVYL